MVGPRQELPVAEGPMGPDNGKGFPFAEGPMGPDNGKGFPFA